MAQEYGPPLSTNSCGARMSYGLNYCGSKIPKLHEYQTQQNVPGDGMNYITGAENMGKYLTWAYDAPTHSGFNAYAACKEYGIDVSSSEFVRLLGMTGNQVAIFQAHADPGTDGSDPVHSHVPHTGAIRSGYHDDYLSTYTNVDIWLLPNR